MRISDWSSDVCSSDLCWISGSNLEKRSVISNIPCPFVSSEVETPVSTALCRGSSRLRSMRTVKRGLPLQFFHRGDELADILDLGLLVHADDDVARVLDLGDEIHQRQAVPFELAGKGGGVGQIGALLVERFDQAVNLILESGAHG